jgi:hypothetical protein
LLNKAIPTFLLDSQGIILMLYSAAFSVIDREISERIESLRIFVHRFLMHPQFFDSYPEFVVGKS